MTYRTVPEGAAPATAIVDDATLDHLARARHSVRQRAKWAHEAAKRAEEHRQDAAMVARERRRRRIVELHEDAGGTLIRFRHRGFPFVLAMFCATSFATVVGLSVWLALAAPEVGLVLGMGFGLPIATLPAITLVGIARDLRPVHLYVTRSGRFVVYQKTPHEPLALGRVADLDIAIYRTATIERSAKIRCDSDTIVECKNLLRRDVELLERAARDAGFKVR